MNLFDKLIPSATDEEIIQQSTPVNPRDGQGSNLADIILEKIAAHEAAQAGAPVIHGGGHPEDAVELPAKVVEVYSKYALLS